jgi:hypothetical protein
MEHSTRSRITRNRELRACTECRKRKLKCDRHLPCTSCTRRNDPSSCNYERSSIGQKNEYERRVKAEARLEHLEMLVQQLSQPVQTSTNGSISTPEDNTNWGSSILDHDVQTSLPDSQTHYNGSTHWSAMLEDIEELRFTIMNDDTIDSGSNSSHASGDDDDGTSVLFGASRPLPYHDIISSFLPPRREVDRLVAAYFRAKAITAPFIHAGQFNRLYQAFWNDPIVTSPLWTSMLFSILDIMTKTSSAHPPGLQNSEEKSFKSDRFAMAAAHCLANGEYYKPKKFAVEALLLYAQRKCLTSVDMSQDLAIIFGTLVRLATSVGYHREPQISSKLSVFEGEMRRRTWSLCMNLDLLVSFQLGMPSNVQYPTWDTRPPSNLLDSDFDETTLVLPPARPDSEITELLLYIAKHKLITVFEKIIRHTLSTSDNTVSELELVDQELRSTYATLPSVFHYRPMSHSIADPPSVIVTRLCVNFIYQKCVCVLHRKYVTRGRLESIKTCYESASNLVDRISDVYNEFQPGGQLETERWFLSSITWHDFLLGCTALCVVLCASKNSLASTANGAGIVDLAITLKRLQNARDICEEQSERSKDTRRVQRLIDAIIVQFSAENSSDEARLQDLPEDGQSIKATGNGIAAHFDEDWHWNESTMIGADEWAYMGQFLDLPNNEL